MANYTQHYQLHQWVPEDDFLRTDFNTNFQKIDDALGGKCELVTGSYVGDGAEEREFDLGFAPKTVFTCNEWGQTYKSPSYYGGLALPGKLVKADSYDTGEAAMSTPIYPAWAIAIWPSGNRRKNRKRPRAGWHGVSVCRKSPAKAGLFCL